MKRKSVAVVGAAETTQMGRIPDLSVLGLHADAALNAMADAGLKPSDIDGVATAGESPVQTANYLGITPTWVDSTSVGGCSFMTHAKPAGTGVGWNILPRICGHASRTRNGISVCRNALPITGSAGSAASAASSRNVG